MSPKALIFIALICLSQINSIAQNLISNGDFNSDSGSLDCSGWTNGCNEPLYLHCDSIGNCLVSFELDTATSNLSESWKVKLFGSFPVAGIIETTIPLLNGTHNYVLSYSMKSQVWGNHNSRGKASLILMRDSIPTELVYSWDTASDWKKFNISTSITGGFGDSLKVRLSSDDCDLCVSSVSYDQIRLEALPPTSIFESTVNNMKFRIYPNPASDFINVQSFNPSDVDSRIFIYNLLGNLVHSEIIAEPMTTIAFANVQSGIYLIEIRSAEKSIFQSKLVIN